MRCYRTDETYLYNDLPTDAPHGVEVTVRYDDQPSVRMTMVRDEPQRVWVIMPWTPMWMPSEHAKRLTY